MMVPEHWQVPDGVYPPREDSLLLQQVLQEQDLSGEAVLDVGTGSGIQAYTAATQGADVTLVDINPDALAAARENLRNKGIPPERFTCVESDLFTDVSGTFDVIVFNPPYVPGGRELETAGEQAWQGGEDGRELIDRFLDAFPPYLADDGTVFLLQSSRNGREETVDRFRNQGYDATVVASEKIPWERLIVLAATSV